MYYFCKKSSRKVVHHSNCRYCVKLGNEAKGHFATLEEANAAGYRLCNRCAPIARYVRRNVKMLQSFCLEKGLLYYLYNGCIVIEAKHSKWKIIAVGKKRSIFLYHENKFESGKDSIVPGYHSQSVRRSTVMEYLEYIAAHEDYRSMHPLKVNSRTVQPPQAAAAPAQPAAAIQKAKPTPPQKGTKRWKKEQARKQREKEYMQVKRVLYLIDQLSAM